MSNVSIIIQGPLNEISLKNIPTYKKYGKVIVSCWNGYDEELMKYIDDDVIFISNDLMKIEHYNFQNIYYQAFTTHAGLEKSEAEFSIKFRSDESYSKLDVFIKALNENPECIVTGDIHFWCDVYPFHISDHTIGGKTKSLLGAFNTVKNICKTTLPEVQLVTRLYHAKPIEKLIHNHVAPESLIMISFLQEIGVLDNIGFQTPLIPEPINGPIAVFYAGNLRRDTKQRLIVDYDMATGCIEIVRSHARVVPTTCMGDVFLNTGGHYVLMSNKLMKEGSEELIAFQEYHKVYADIEVACR